MTDIVERLKGKKYFDPDDFKLLDEAVDEIERLRGENKEQQDKIFVLNNKIFVLGKQNTREGRKKQ